MIFLSTQNQVERAETTLRHQQPQVEGLCIGCSDLQRYARYIPAWA